MDPQSEKLGIRDTDLVSRYFWGAIHGVIALFKLFIPESNKSNDGFTPIIEDVDLNKRI